MIDSNITNWLFRRLNRRKLLIKKITRRIILSNDLFRSNQLYLPPYIVTTQDVSSLEFFRNYTESAMLVRKAYIEETNNVSSNEDYLHPGFNLGSLFLAFKSPYRYPLMIKCTNKSISAPLGMEATEVNKFEQVSSAGYQT